jgi:stage III sporulation protein AD
MSPFFRLSLRKGEKAMDLGIFLGITLLAVTFLSLLRQTRPELAVLLSAAAGVIIFLRLIGPLQELVRTFEYLAAQAQINLVYLQTVFRVMGVAYLTGFTAQICRDAGEGALALKLEMAGKVIILFLAVPVLVAILETVLRML